MDDELMQITPEGFSQIIQILNRDGSLDRSVPANDEYENLRFLESIADDFLRTSREKGNQRTDIEYADAHLIACFKLWCEEFIKQRVK